MAKKSVTAPAAIASGSYILRNITRRPGSYRTEEGDFVLPGGEWVAMVNPPAFYSVELKLTKIKG